MDEIKALYVRSTEAHKVLGIGKSSFYTLAKEEKDFPKKITVRGSVTYSIQELCDWWESHKEDECA